MADPFSTIHAAIWTTLEAYSGFTSLVPSANRVKLTTKRGQIAGTPKYALKPQVQVVPANGRSKVLCSSGMELRQTWLIQIRLGDERVTSEFFPTMWAIYRAMAAASSAGSTIRTATWNSKTFVISCELTDFEESYDLESEVKAWKTAWAYEVFMQFATSDLPPS